MPSKIIWTDETWNPIVGCSKCSPGCEHCYAERMARRQAAMVLKKKEVPDVMRGQDRYVAVIDPNGKWNGHTAIDDWPFGPSEMDKPLRVKKATRFFVCSMGDLYHETVSRTQRDMVFEVVEQCREHTFLLLTKRAERMYEDSIRYGAGAWPDNVWCGITVCNQEEAELKIPFLVRMHSKVRFLSIEPMLGPITIPIRYLCDTNKEPCWPVNWIILGGESGPGARPIKLEWVRGIRDQCTVLNIPFLFKQMICNGKRIEQPALDGKKWEQYPCEE